MHSVKGWEIPPALEADVPLEVDAIYRAHAARVASFAARLAGPDLDVEDIVHEVFLIVHRELPKFRKEAKLTTWLYGITANVVRDRRRKEKRRWLRHLLGDREQRTLAPDSITPVEELERRQATTIVYKALDKLPENYRTVLALFELEGLSGQEIAELLGTNLKTLWVWLHRARAEFRKRLAELHPEEFAAPAMQKGRHV